MAMTTMHGERGGGERWEEEEVLPVVPAGVRFTPTDIELVFYLRSRVAAASSPFPRFLFQEADVYATEPWNLPNDSFRFQSVEKDMHFFTPRHPTSTTSQRARRTVGHGVWQGVGKDNHIMNRSQLIGHKTQLHFVIFKGKGKKEKINTGWIMHEFRLHYSSSNEANFDDLVLCRIHLKKSSNSSNKGWEEDAFAGSAADPGAVSFTQHQEEEEAEGRLVKRRRLEEDGLMADSNIETRIYGINIYNDQSAGQPAAPLSSSLPNMPSFIPLEEPRELASMALEVVSVADSDAISITQQQQQQQQQDADADADSDFALSLEQLLEEDVEEEADAEEEAVGRQLTKRRRLEENGLMADSNY